MKTEQVKVVHLKGFISVVVLLEYCCRENISLNCVIGLDIRKVLIMTIDLEMTLIDT
mgnify:CR=1 FL=1